MFCVPAAFKHGRTRLSMVRLQYVLHYLPNTRRDSYARMHQLNRIRLNLKRSPALPVRKCLFSQKQPKPAPFITKCANLASLKDVYFSLLNPSKFKINPFQATL